MTVFPPGRDGVFLDACVLYPPLLRQLLLETAAAGLYRPAWTARVIEEWRRAVARKEGPQALAAMETAAARMARAFPAAAGAAPSPEAEAALAEGLPDPADAHVIAAAEAAGAGTILTFNLGDFPRRRLAGLGLVARHPDGFLWELHGHDPAPIAAALAGALGPRPPGDLRRALKRARLARLGKAVEAAG